MSTTDGKEIEEDLSYLHAMQQNANDDVAAVMLKHIARCNGRMETEIVTFAMTLNALSVLASVNNHKSEFGRKEAMLNAIKLLEGAAEKIDLPEPVKNAN